MPIPVILDTDIGGDIDDTWALAMLLRCPELEPRLIVSDTGDTTYRAKLIAKLLETDQRSSIPVGIGAPTECHRTCNQPEWVADYDLASYPGPVHDDGVQALIDTIMNADEPPTLICIGPVTNVRLALEREPRITEKARFVGMHGCLRKSQRPGGVVFPESNVINDVAACQAALHAAWPVTITPLDTCGFVVLRDRDYRAVHDCEDPLIRALIENYRIWAANVGRASEFGLRSSTLFDTVAIYLAFAEDFLVMEDLPVRVRDDGMIVQDPGAKLMRVASEWRDMDAFMEFLSRRLCSGARPTGCSHSG